MSDKADLSKVKISITKKQGAVGAIPPPKQHKRVSVIHQQEFTIPPPPPAPPGFVIPSPPQSPTGSYRQETRPVQVTVIEKMPPTQKQPPQKQHQKHQKHQKPQEQPPQPCSGTLSLPDQLPVMHERYVATEHGARIMSDKKHQPRIFPTPTPVMKERLEPTKTTYYGWAHSVRLGANLACVHLYTGQRHIQIVLRDEAFAVHKSKLTMYTCLGVAGYEVFNSRSPTFFIEVQVYEKEDVDIIGYSPGLSGATSLEPLRSARQNGWSRMQWTLSYATRLKDCVLLRDDLNFQMTCYFKEQGTIKLDLPTILGYVQKNGGFAVDYFGRPAYLRTSAHMYLETLLAGYGQVWSSTDVYDSTPDSSGVAEYRLIEAEYPLFSAENRLERLMTHMENFTRSLMMNYIKELRCKEVYHEPYKKVSFSSLAATVAPDAGKETLEHSYAMAILDQVRAPVFLTDLPASFRQFSVERTADGFCVSAALLLPGAGCVGYVDVRELDLEQLIRSIEDDGLKAAELYWYTDSRRYGACHHGGFSLHYEKFIQAVSHAQCNPIDHLCESMLFPRQYGIDAP